jgi:NitT/TauT family transport system permease protein
VAVICLVILVVWYLAAIPMNAVVTENKIAAAGGGFSNCCTSHGTRRGP